MRSVNTVMRAAAVAVAFCLVLVAAAGAADRPDSWITMKTKLALMTTKGVDSWDVNVDTVKGAVTLHGKVASEAAKEKAESVARTIEGVSSVKNMLQVVAEPNRDAVDASDDAIKDQVKKAFDADPLIKDSGIDVASVNRGVVLLSGSAKSLEAQVRAVEAARQVPGVRRVSSEITLDGGSQ